MLLTYAWSCHGCGISCTQIFWCYFQVSSQGCYFFSKPLALLSDVNQLLPRTMLRRIYIRRHFFLSFWTFVVYSFSPLGPAVEEGDAIAAGPAIAERSAAPCV